MLSSAHMGYYVLEASILFPHGHLDEVTTVYNATRKSFSNCFYAIKDNIIVSGNKENTPVAIFPAIGSIQFRTT